MAVTSRASESVRLIRPTMPCGGRGGQPMTTPGQEDRWRAGQAVDQAPCPSPRPRRWPAGSITASCRWSPAWPTLARAAVDDVQVWPVAGGAAVLAAPGSPFNKVIGVGFGDPGDPEDWALIEREHDRRQAPRPGGVFDVGRPAPGQHAHRARLPSGRIRERPGPTPDRRCEQRGGDRGVGVSVVDGRRRAAVDGDGDSRASCTRTSSTARPRTSRSTARPWSARTSCSAPFPAWCACSRTGSRRWPAARSLYLARRHCAALRRLHAARPSPAWRAVGAAARPAGPRQGGRLRAGRGDDPAGLEVAAERAARGLRVDLQSRRSWCTNRRGNKAPVSGNGRRQTAARAQAPSLKPKPRAATHQRLRPAFAPAP